MNRYPINILWSEDDGEYLATCAAFPGLSAFGETEEEALKEAKIALELFIESYRERGLALPKPAKVSKYSGQLRLRLPKSLHERAANIASHDGVSLNQYITNALNQVVSSEEARSYVD
jgi:predicted RNase H-like HicB family nuclease